MKKCLGLLVFLIAAVSGVNFAEEAPPFELKLDAPSTLTLDGKEVKINGDFEKDAAGGTALAVGRDFGPKIPAASVFGENGTIAFSLKFKDATPANTFAGNRHLVTLRGEGRQYIGFYILQTERKLTFTYKMTVESTSIRPRQDLEPGKWYRAVCTWDGMNVKYYLNGELQGEQPQPFVPSFPVAGFPSYSHLSLGPFQDGSVPCKPWNENSCFLSNLKVWKRALSTEEVVRDAGKVVADLSGRYPAYLSVPRLSAPPQFDGNLESAAWQQAASFVSLADGTVAADSFTYENNRPLFAHDGANLYIAFQTIFPTGANLRKGETRGATEPEVWPDESFEFHVALDQRKYRFGGNVAGGYCESLNNGSEFNGQWKYVSTLSCRIDNRWHWRGEIAIPFATLGMADPIGKELKVNFCRTWRCFDRTGITSLAINSEHYADETKFATLKISEGGNACLTREMKNPNFGAFEQKVQLTAPSGGKFKYQVGLVSSQSPGSPFPLVEQAVVCKAGESQQLDLTRAIANSSCDQLLFQFTDGDNHLLLQQLVPFQLSNDFISVIPVFGQAQVVLEPRYNVLKNKLGDQAAQAVILAPDGNKIYSGNITAEGRMAVAFERQNPAGTYRVRVIVPGDANKILTEKTFYYPGIGAWEKLPEIAEVLPPFTPIKATIRKDRFTAQLWGRTYGFNRSLLPTSISSQKKELLAAPAEWRIKGQLVPAGKLKIDRVTPGRVDFTATTDTEDYHLRQTSFLEYDGVLFNRVKLTAKANLTDVRIVLPMPEAMAKFMHATMAGFGGGGRINAALDQEISIPFHPVVWVGEYEHGLSFFAETNAGWKTMPAKPIRIFRDGNRTMMEVTFAAAVPAGEELRVEFGLIATPVRPLPSNYPLNLFCASFGVHLNQAPPKAPVIYAAIDCNEGAGFFDLPLTEKNPANWQWLVAGEARVRKNHAIFTPYTAAVWGYEEYPEMKANVKEWELSPASHCTYTRDGKKHGWYWLCPASDARKWFAWRFAELLKKIPLRGIYFDFGAASRCCNELHGCNNRFPLLAMREFYRRIAAAFVHSGVKDYVIVIHNSETVQVPVITHVTHFYNGEGLRQMSSTTFHNGKDILETYTPLDFATEHSSLPFGVTSSIYLPTDPLLPEFGGGKEDQELYRFRMTKAGLAGALVHNTIPSPDRQHHGLFDKVVRIYDEFGVPQAEFLPYWRNGDWVKIQSGKDIYVSLYRSKDKPEVLAVISHLAKEHLDQEIALEFNPAKFGFQQFNSVRELLAGNDPEYERLYAETNRERMPIKLGDFGVSDCRLDGNRLTLKIKFHSVAIVKLVGDGSSQPRRSTP